MKCTINTRLWVEFFNTWLCPRFCFGGSPPPTPTNTTQNVNSIPAQLMPFAVGGLKAARTELFNTDAKGNITGVKPFQPFSTDAHDSVAGFSSLQTQAQNSAAGMTMPGQFNTATGIAGAAGANAQGAGQAFAQQATDPNATAAYMSPYMQNVVAQQEREANRNYDISNTKEMGAATQNGAFGGSREAIMAAENERNRNMELSNIQATGAQSAFQNAQAQQQFGASLGIQGDQAAAQSAATLGQLGSGQQAAQQGIIDTQAQQGALQQQQNQQLINTDITNYQNQQQQPYRAIGFMSDLVHGTPVNNITTTQYQANPSMTTQIGSTIGALGSMYQATQPGKKGGGIVGYSVGGEIESKLYDMTPEQLQEIIQTATSESERSMAKKVLAEKSMAAGGIVAFAQGGSLADQLGALEPKIKSGIPNSGWDRESALEYKTPEAEIARRAEEVRQLKFEAMQEELRAKELAAAQHEAAKTEALYKPKERSNATTANEGQLRESKLAEVKANENALRDASRTRFEAGSVGKTSEGIASKAAGAAARKAGIKATMGRVGAAASKLPHGLGKVAGLGLTAATAYPPAVDAIDYAVEKSPKTMGALNKAYEGLDSRVGSGNEAIGAVNDAVKAARAKAGIAAATPTEAPTTPATEAPTTPATEAPTTPATEDSTKLGLAAAAGQAAGITEMPPFLTVSSYRAALAGGNPDALQYHQQHPQDAETLIAQAAAAINASENKDYGYTTGAPVAQRAAPTGIASMGEPMQAQTAQAPTGSVENYINNVPLPDQPEAEKPLSHYIQQQNDAYAQTGANDPNAAQEYRSQLMAQKANTKDEDSRQGWLRMAEFFSHWGTTPGPPLVAGLKALQQTMPGILQDKKEREDLTRALDKSMYQLNYADHLDKKGDAHGAMAARERAADEAMKQKDLIQKAQMEKARMLSNIEVAKTYAGRSSGVPGAAAAPGSKAYIERGKEISRTLADLTRREDGLRKREDKALATKQGMLTGDNPSNIEDYTATLKALGTERGEIERERAQLKQEMLLRGGIPMGAPEVNPAETLTPPPPPAPVPTNGLVVHRAN